MALQRITKEFKDWQARSVEYIGLESISDDMFTMLAIMIGKQYTPYEKGIYEISITFPPSYPLRPPKFQFLTKIYNSCVMNNGIVHLDILKDSWSPAVTISNMLMNVYEFIFEKCGYPFTFKGNKILKELQLNDHYQYLVNASDYNQKYADGAESFSKFHFPSISVDEYIQNVTNIIKCLLMNSYGLDINICSIIIEYYNDERYFCGLYNVKAMSVQGINYKELKDIVINENNNKICDMNNEVSIVGMRWYGLGNHEMDAIGIKFNNDDKVAHLVLRYKNHRDCCLCSSVVQFDYRELSFNDNLKDLNINDSTTLELIYGTGCYANEICPNCEWNYNVNAVPKHR
eukprot:387026_1